MDDLWLVDCAGRSGIQTILGHLDGLRVKVIESAGDLPQQGEGGLSASPCAVLALVNSRKQASRSLIEPLLKSIGSTPLLVLDERFDDRFAQSVLTHGALDYLDTARVTTDKLLRRIEWAILRNGHRAAATSRDTNRDDGQVPIESRQRLEQLAPRGRQILELLATGLTPKQISCQLGTRPKTVWNQLAELRGRFAVDSNHALALLFLQRAPEEKSVE